MTGRSPSFGGSPRSVAGCLIFLIAVAVMPLGASTTRVDLGGGAVAALDDQRQIFLEALPEKGEGLNSFSRRLCADAAAAEVVASANDGVRQLLAGVRYRVPFSSLRPEMQLRVVRGLFPQDRGSAEGWRHRVVPISGGSPTLWHVARWFTGAGENFVAIREANDLRDPDLAGGQEILIPRELLRPVFQVVLPASHPLRYDRDDEGDVALYDLQAGEALYSAVVVRFTGRVYAEDVNAVAEEIAARNGIRDVTDIPVGYSVRIPFELLQPEFLPAGDPRRREYEEGLVASGRFSNPVRAARLEGITVILDPGHGGADVGASVGGVWESLYVYDIVLRIRRILESTTAAEVVVTTADGGQPVPTDRDVLPYSKSHRVLTDPPYPILDSTVGVHLRWYLSNSVYRRAAARGRDGDQVVFLSVHADSLHPSLRGAMIYVPGAAYRGGTYGKSGSVYASRREFREAPRVSFGRPELERSEGLSRELARRMIESLRRRELAIHPFKPVREKVIRNRRSWVPAVLRYNAVPAQMLLEVCNLANQEDRRLIQQHDFRGRVARAVVEGLLDYYGDSEPLPAVAGP